MAEPSHGEILRAIGNLEGRFEGIEKGIKANTERASRIDEKVNAVHEDVSKIQLWKAEVRGVGLGVKAGFLLAAGTFGAGVVKAGEWLTQKVW